MKPENTDSPSVGLNDLLAVPWRVERTHDLWVEIRAGMPV